MPCTTLLVGKKASYDGSTFIARNEDSLLENSLPKNLWSFTQKNSQENTNQFYLM